MTNEMIKAKAIDVFAMDEDELEDFGLVVDMSDVDANAKMYLYQAIEDRQLHLREMKEMAGSGVVASEVRAGEL